MTDRPALLTRDLSKAYGKVKAKAKRGEMMPEGWMIDREGRPLLDPARANEGFLLPIGGHKGYGLALLVGLLAVAVLGLAVGFEALRDPSQRTHLGRFFLGGAGGGTGNGALGEAAKTSGAGESIYCIGVDVDQWETVPEAHPCLITSAEKKLTDGTADLLNQAKDGSIKGGNFVGKTGLSEFHDFDSKIPADVKTKVADIVKQLEDGSLKVA